MSKRIHLDPCLASTNQGMALAVLPLESDNANHENVSFHYLPKENLGDALYISIFRVLDLRIDEIAALLLYYCLSSL